jgi:SAM-dependent methyltransferase
VTESRLERESQRYERHHAKLRSHGEFVFVPERLAFFKRHVGGPGKDVLDLGCRTGSVTRHYAEGNHVVGVDIDQSALKRIPPELGVSTVWADVEDPLPFEDSTYDTVVCGELLEHLRDPERLMTDVRRVLRPGGTFVGSVPNAYRLKSRLLFLLGRPPETDPTHLRLYSPAMLGALLAPFEEAHLEFIGGRYCRLHPRLLGRDVVFWAR